MNTSKLRRPQAGDLTEREFDLVVIGGGITGARILLDAASRGLKAVLFEKGDFASATSSASTSLFHGGLRYLQNLQFLVTFESVRERDLARRLAPHIVRRLPFIIPLYGKNRLKNLTLHLGLFVYSLMAGLWGNSFHKRISAQAVIAACPGINPEGLTGGLRYYDCGTDDARYTLTVIKTAADYGALAMNYAEVVSKTLSNGIINGVMVRDHLASAGAQPIFIRAKQVISATGVWSQKTAELGGGKSQIDIVPAKGIHIFLPHSKLPIKEALIVDSAHDDGRFCFAVPFYDMVIVGTTDSKYLGDIDKVQADPEEKQYVLDALNARFPQAHLTLCDVTGDLAGLRPLVSQKGATSTAEVSRQHSLTRLVDGLITITGGKLTTSRYMAEQAVDLSVKCLSATKLSPHRFTPCQTKQIMIGCDADPSSRQECERLALSFPFKNENTSKTLYAMYGKETEAVLELVRAQPELGQLVAPGHPYIMAQVAYAVRNEAAITIEDVLSRRIRLLNSDRAAALATADRVSKLMAGEMSWTEAQRLHNLDWFTHKFETTAWRPNS